MKKGFTLMEILAVLLVIAVLASFAVPAVRSIMAQVRYQRAKVAGAKLAEAIRVFYTDSKGYRITGSISGANIGTTIAASATDCANPAISGIPPYETANAGDIDVSQLFYCNYLAVKDFQGLASYTFNVCAFGSGTACLVRVSDSSTKHNKGCFSVNRDGTILEGVEGC